MSVTSDQWAAIAGIPTFRFAESHRRKYQPLQGVKEISGPNMASNRRKMALKGRAAVRRRRLLNVRNREVVMRKYDIPRRLMSAGEVKGVDTDLAYNPIIATTSTNAGIFVLNLVVPGTGSWNRVGRKISMKSVRLHGQCAMACLPTAATGVMIANVLRMSLVYDKQPSSGTIPTFDTIFGNTAPDGTESTQFFSPRRYDNLARFEVIRDTVINMPIPSTTSFGTNNQITFFYPFDIFVNLRGRETVFSG